MACSLLGEEVVDVDEVDVFGLRSGAKCLAEPVFGEDRELSLGGFWPEDAAGGIQVVERVYADRLGQPSARAEQRVASLVEASTSISVSLRRDHQLPTSVASAPRSEWLATHSRQQSSKTNEVILGSAFQISAPTSLIRPRDRRLRLGKTWPNQKWK